MTTQNIFNLNVVHPSWQPYFNDALKTLDPVYFENLTSHSHWLPGPDKIFNAFSLPTNQINYVLIGESPYPRSRSANGYAFWDAAVTDLWSSTGLSKPVNRATSLRNMIKMLLIAENLLDANHVNQQDIANLNKNNLVQTNSELFQNFIRHGFLLLNASLVLQPTAVRKDALAWNPFVKYLLNFLFEKNPNIQLLLFGQIANNIDKLINHPQVRKLISEHPYNISFIHNPRILEFFKPLHLLIKNS